MRRLDVQHPTVNDAEKTLWRAMGVRSWPTLMLLGPDGNVLLSVSGERNGPLIAVAIEEALLMYAGALVRDEKAGVDALVLPKQLLGGSPPPASNPLFFPCKLAFGALKGRGEVLFVSDAAAHRVVVVSTADGVVHFATASSGVIVSHPGTASRASAICPVCKSS